MSAATDAQPIVLERVFFTRTVIESIPSHEPGGGPVVAPVNTLNVEKADDDGLFSVQMKSTVNANRDKSSPYFVDVECMALLRVVDKSLSEDEAKGGALVTGHNVLYGAIREAVAWSTGRHAYGQLLLGLSFLKPKSAEAVPKKD